MKMADEYGFRDLGALRKHELIFEILKKHVDEPPRPLRAIDPGIPAEVEAMVLRALAKQPDERFGSMDELEAAISALPEDLQTAPVAVPS